MTFPNSVSSGSARLWRWADRPPAAHTGWTSVKSRLDPSEYPPNSPPETNLTPGMLAVDIQRLHLWLFYETAVTVYI